MFLGDAPDHIGKLVNVDIGIELLREEYKLMDYEHLHFFEGCNSVVMTMEEFLEKTGATPETLDAGGFIRELTQSERKTIVVKTDRTAVIGDLNYIYFTASYF